VREDGIAVNRARRVFSVILLLVVGCICIGWADTWEEIRGATGTIQAIKADFVQEKHLSILSRPFISKGVFYYQAPDSLRWEYTFPVRSILLMHKGKLRRYTETGKGRIEDSRMDSKGMQIILQEIALWLGGHFSDDPAFDAVLKDGRRIVLTPKEEGFSKMIQHIDLRLSDTPGIIKSVEIYEGPDSYTRIIFTNTEINQKIEEVLFLGIS
jgi:outer membrane lipoprotein-sorting protein